MYVMEKRGWLGYGLGIDLLYMKDILSDNVSIISRNSQNKNGIL